MNDVLSIAAATIPLAPLAAAIATLFIRGGFDGASRVRALIAAVGAGAALVASVAVLWELSRGPYAAATWQLGNWLSIPGVPSLDDAFEFRIDAFTAVLQGAIALAVLILAVHTLLSGREDPAEKDAISASLFLLATTAVLICSDHVLQFLIFWQLTSVIGFFTLAIRGQDSLAAAAARKGLLLGRLGDIPLMLGLLFLWQQGIPAQSGADLGFMALLSNAGQSVAESEPQRVMLGAAATFLLAGVVTRCGQIPFLGWVDDVSSSSAPRMLALQTSLVMPAGVALFARCSGVVRLSEPLELATLVIGGFTVFFASLSAACSTGALRVLGYSACSLFGWMLLGIGTGSAVATIAAVRLLVVQIVAGAAVCCLVKNRAEHVEVPTAANGLGANSRASFVPAQNRWAYLVVAVVLASAFWGQGSILATLWEQGTAATGGASEMETRAGRGAIDIVIIGMGTLGVFLLAVALFRQFFAASNEHESMPHPAATSHGATLWIAVATLAVAVVVLLPPEVLGAASLEMVTSATVSSTEPARALDFFSISISVLPALAGIVVAWMRAASAPETEGSRARVVESFVRLSRNRYYFDDFFFLSIVLPIRAMGQLSRFFDWFLIDGVMVQLPARIPANVAKLARPLQNSATGVYALSIALGTAVLLATILWLRG